MQARRAGGAAAHVGPHQELAHAALQDGGAERVGLRQQHREAVLARRREQIGGAQHASDLEREALQPRGELGVGQLAAPAREVRQLELDQRERAAEAARLADLVAHHVLEEGVGVGARDGIAERAVLERAEAQRIRDRHGGRRREALGDDAIAILEVRARELVGEAHEADHAALVAQRHGQRRLRRRLRA